LRAVRAISDALLVCKRGPMGCVAYPGPIPDRAEGGVVGRGFPVEVYNVLGAGDAFMAGFLRGWLRDEPIETACAYANACGAFAVSRLLCSPEYPTWPELRHFLDHGAASRALRRDPTLTHLHHATTRRPGPSTLRAFAIDHRVQLEAMAEEAGVPRERITDFKRLAVRAAAQVAAGREGFGMLLDSDYGEPALAEALGHGLWLARPVERPGSRPLALVAHDIGSHLVEWPLTQTVKVLCFYRPDDPADLRERQDAILLAVHEACRAGGRELLIEIVAGKHGPLTDTTVADVVSHLYGLGIKPDWWKLEPQRSPAAWDAIAAVITREDPFCRGVLMLGLEAPEAQLREAFAAAADVPMVRGFAVGRTLFVEAAQAWLNGRIGDEAAVADMADRFARLALAWDEAVGGRRAA
jgi:5-dehydro-2-deoxygluconokinase